MFTTGNKKPSKALLFLQGIFCGLIVGAPVLLSGLGIVKG